MQYFGCITFMLFIFFLKCRFNWELCILSGSPEEGASTKGNWNAITEGEIKPQQAKCKYLGRVGYRRSQCISLSFANATIQHTE